jgi:hypothetical protein
MLYNVSYPESHFREEYKLIGWGGGMAIAPAPATRIRFLVPSAFPAPSRNQPEEAMSFADLTTGLGSAV